MRKLFRKNKKIEKLGIKTKIRKKIVNSQRKYVIKMISMFITSMEFDFGAFSLLKVDVVMQCYIKLSNEFDAFIVICVFKSPIEKTYHFEEKNDKKNPGKNDDVLLLKQTAQSQAANIND